MSAFERKDASLPSAARRRRWARRLRRTRDEVGIYLVRGAATAAGGAVVTYGIIWLQIRI
ncbi:hypothetical protein ACFCZ4_00020 [Streptomyces microflavus]|uniref:hypothetical protein n=1 Tax=Streptomyces microflavus TaxID=1919 RepID=UPI00192A9789|nr:hypothetical protein [Streptomyces microflavus]QQZ58022.1 hypothetical protein IFE09_34440 [Streptomyces microflavus]